MISPIPCGQLITELHEGRRGCPQGLSCRGLSCRGLFRRGLFCRGETSHALGLRDGWTLTVGKQDADTAFVADLLVREGAEPVDGVGSHRGCWAGQSEAGSFTTLKLFHNRMDVRSKESPVRWTQHGPVATETVQHIPSCHYRVLSYRSQSRQQPYRSRSKQPTAAPHPPRSPLRLPTARGPPPPPRDRNFRTRKTNLNPPREIDPRTLGAPSCSPSARSP